MPAAVIPRPCDYRHLKLRALNGERDTLSIRELSFVGVSTARVVTGDWLKVELPSAGYVASRNSLRHVRSATRAPSATSLGSTSVVVVVN